MIQIQSQQTFYYISGIGNFFKLLTLCFRKLLNVIGDSKGAKETETASTIIKLKPETINLGQTTRLAQLEHRFDYFIYLD